MRTSSINPTAITNSDDTLPIGRLVGLHLIPGFLVVLATAAIGWLLRDSGLPSLLPLLLAIPLVLLPVELGALFWAGKRQYGRYTLRGVLPYAQPMSAKAYATWIPGVFVASIALFLAFGITDTILFERVFFWWPAWMNPDYASLSGQPAPVLWGTVALLMVFGNLIGPAVEELYFRGYLLPQLAPLGRWGIVLHAALFAVYHFWSPWAIISRTAGMIPIAWAAQRTRNIIVPIAVHCTLNTVGTLLSLGVILGS